MVTGPEPPKELVAGKYRLVQLLGQGGMGTVWEGVHEVLGTKVAVKFIDAEFASSDDARQRFLNEAKAAARLRSKHVVQVYDQGVSADGRPYIVMEWLGGEPLDVRLDRVLRLSADETSRIATQICRALAKAHAAGVVHRDLKPENVFLVHDDEDHADVAKVVDFGIAKFVDAAVPGSSSTQTGAVLGTPQFMSPEQARGLRSVDHRTDLWSVGVIAYRCLTGVLPFKGEAMGDLLVNICTADPPAASSVFAGVPAGFDAWVQRALARDPAARFQSAAELANALASVCGAERAGPAPSGPSATVVNPDVGAEVARAVAAEGATTPAYDAQRRGAITAQPYATTPPPDSAPGRKPFWVLGAVAIVIVSAVVARTVMRASHEREKDAQSEPAKAAAVPVEEKRAGEPLVAPSPEPPVAASASAVAGAGTPPSAATTPAVNEPGKRGRPRTQKPSASDKRPASTAEKPAPSPRASRPPDVLGY
jgi:tRNA A-37 threonylcarbamoyl transferase component Bud32